jgi:hypothetical protein
MRALPLPLLLVVVAAASLGAQDSTAAVGTPRRVPVAVADSAQDRPKPMNYFFRSLLIPGWGQASLDRKLPGAIFVAFEGVTLGMALKANSELHYLELTNSERVEAKRQEVQDWLFLLALNHVFSALEAFVSANLYDFPGDLKMRSLPGSRTGVGLTLPLR